MTLVGRVKQHYRGANPLFFFGIFPGRPIWHLHHPDGAATNGFHVMVTNQ